MTQSLTHPVLDAARTMSQVLTAVADANPTFMSAADKASALIALARVEAQASELRLRILVDADDVADATAARDAADWFAHATNGRGEDARADRALARALDRRYPALQAALRDGSANLAQARVIARALDQLHDASREHQSPIAADVLQRAEDTLVGYCASHDPRAIARLGRRILDVVAPEVAEGAEARRLAALEAEAHRKTRLSLRRVGDGTTRLSGLIPDAVATRLATYLTAFTSPRQPSGATTFAGADRIATGATEGPADVSAAGEADPVGTDPWLRLPYPRRLGEAFCQFLELTDPSRIPLHGGDATTLVVTIDFDALRSDLATAQLLGRSALPGDPEAEGLGETITAAEARRLACGAQILPAILDGASVPLDLGRSRRLFSAAQRKALLVRDHTCRAEGCDIPGAWSEAHHRQPWHTGGSTDLDNGVLLCSHHHHRAHDPAMTASRLPNGDVRFHRRT